MKIRIGTRVSPLALVQTEMVKNRIKAAFPETQIEIVAVTTKGDRHLDRTIAALGGHGVFVREMEDALQSGAYDIAVHSAKDLPPNLADGLVISSALPRGDWREAIITRRGEAVEDRPDFIVGSGSNRRILNLRRVYPYVGVQSIRGGVDARMEKLLSGEYDALILAMAGLERLGFDQDSRFDITPYDFREFIPPPCQGIIVTESCANDPINDLLREISDTNALHAFECEYEVVRLLQAECETPLGAYSFVHDNSITLSASLGDGKMITDTSAIPDRLALARRLAARL